VFARAQNISNKKKKRHPLNSLQSMNDFRKHVKKTWVDELGRTRVTLGPPPPEADIMIESVTPEQSAAALRYDQSRMGMGARGSGYKDNHLRPMLHDPDSHAATNVFRDAASADETLRSKMSALGHATSIIPRHNATDDPWRRLDTAAFRDQPSLPKIINNDDVLVGSLDKYAVAKTGGAVTSFPHNETKNGGMGAARSREISVADQARLFLETARRDISQAMQVLEDKLHRAVGNIKSSDLGRGVDPTAHIKGKKPARVKFGLVDHSAAGMALNNDSLQPGNKTLDYKNKPKIALNSTYARADAKENNTIQPKTRQIEHKNTAKDIPITFSQTVQAALTSVSTNFKKITGRCSTVTAKPNDKNMTFPANSEGLAFNPMGGKRRQDASHVNVVEFRGVASPLDAAPLNNTATNKPLLAPGKNVQVRANTHVGAEVSLSGDRIGNWKTQRRSELVRTY
jgi:hypothetical protein